MIAKNRKAVTVLGYNGLDILLIDQIFWRIDIETICGSIEVSYCAPLLLFFFATKVFNVPRGF